LPPPARLVPQGKGRLKPQNRTSQAHQIDQRKGQPKAGAEELGEDGGEELGEDGGEELGEDGGEGLGEEGG